MIRFLLGITLTVVLIINIFISATVLYRLPTHEEIRIMRKVISIIRFEERQNNLLKKLNQIDSILTKKKNRRLKDGKNKENSSKSGLSSLRDRIEVQKKIFER